MAARRLPVIQTTPSEDAEARARPPWQWILITALLTLTSFLPLAMIGVWVGSRLALRLGETSVVAGVVGALPVLMAFVLAAGFGGALLGRFSDRAGIRDAALGGALGAAFVLVLALQSGEAGPWRGLVVAAVLLVGAGAGCAALGARWARLPRSSGAAGRDG